MRNPPDEKNRRLVAKIEEYQKLRDVNTERLAQKIGISRDCMYVRKRNVDTLRLGELRQIAKALNIPMAELTQYI